MGIPQSYPASESAPDLRLEWRVGAPTKPWSEEWFIAETIWGDRVVLCALPEEWTYDFKTADDTYIKHDKIKRWMQFPDSEYVAPRLVSVAQGVGHCGAQVHNLATKLLDFIDNEGPCATAWQPISETAEALREALAQGAVPCGESVAWQAEKDRLMLWIASLLNQIGKLETAALSSTDKTGAA